LEDWAIFLPEVLELDLPDPVAESENQQTRYRLDWF
jgi:hypothetical protein